MDNKERKKEIKLLKRKRKELMLELKDSNDFETLKDLNMLGIRLKKLQEEDGR